MSGMKVASGVAERSGVTAQAGTTQRRKAVIVTVIITEEDWGHDAVTRLMLEGRDRAEHFIQARRK